MSERDLTKLVIENRSLAERCCGIYLGSMLFSRPARVALLIVYGLLISLAVYQALQIEIYFSKSYFVSDSSEVSKWFAANEEYFSTGGVQTMAFV